MISALFSVLLIASGTPASTNQPDPASAPTSEAPKEERKICKREAVSESRIGAKRICMTAAEWRERSSGSVNGLGDFSK